MDNLQELYQELIIDHGTKPRNVGTIANCTHHAQGFNPLCGDEMELYLTIDADAIIRDVKFEGKGCAISTASTSLMTQYLIGKTIEQARATMNEFVNMTTQSPNADHEALGKLVVFAGVNQYPARVKCATLAWHTLIAALEQRAEAATTE